MTVFCLVVILAVALHTVAENPLQVPGFNYLGSVPNSGDLSTRRTYYLSTTTDTWVNAFNRCSSLGSKLVSPFNPAQDDDLRKVMILANLNGVIWIGARRNGAVWEWPAKNINMLSSNWHSQTCQSNNGCASAYNSGCNWAWCAENCNNSHYYVCEYQ